MATQSNKKTSHRKRQKLDKLRSHGSDSDIRKPNHDRARVFTRRRFTRLLLVLLSGGLVGIALFIPQYAWRKMDTGVRAKELHEQVRAILFDQGGIYSSHCDDPLSIERRSQLETARGLVEEALLLNAGGRIQSDLHNDLSEIYLEEKSFVKAEEEVGKALAVDPNWAEAHANLGDILDITGRTEEAAAQYRLAIRLNPSNSHGYTGLCVLYTRESRLTEALSYAQAASRLEPLNAAAWDCLGIALDYLGNHADSEHAFRTALKLQPSRAQLHRSLAISLFNQSKKPIAQSLAEIRAATQLWPDNPNNWSFLAKVLRRAGFTPEAYAAARKTLELDPNNATAEEVLKKLSALPGEIKSYESQYDTLLVKALNASAVDYDSK